MDGLLFCTECKIHLVNCDHVAWATGVYTAYVNKSEMI
uniref:Uncharacterized protein n=1 Tax=Anguilla anguilla TaxID=7936 RepID=A0A0E9PN32_ANGAN